MIDGVRISLIVAVAANGVIGRDGAMPWRLSTDQKRFRRLTMGKPVVMGRRTFDSLPAPLTGRTNIVVSGRSGFRPDGAVVKSSLEDALAAAVAIASGDDAGEVMVIGGARIYDATLAEADRLYVTHVELTPDGDTFFAGPDQEVWRPVSEERVPAGEKDTAPTRFVVYERRDTPARS